MSKNLWDAEHPSWCAEGNWNFVPNANLHRNYDSWAAFMADWVSNEDYDNSLLFRWDWIKEDPQSPTHQDEMYFRSGPGKGKDRIMLHYVMQEKGYLFSVAVPVTDGDQAAARAYLEPRGEALRKMWEPILDRTVEEELEALI